MAASKYNFAAMALWIVFSANLRLPAADPSTATNATQSNAPEISTAPVSGEQTWSLFVFQDPTSLESRLMTEYVLINDRVAGAVKAGYVCTLIARGRSPALEKQQQVSIWPTIILLRPDGTEADRISGYVQPEILAKMLWESKWKPTLPQLLERAAAPNANAQTHYELAAMLKQRGNDNAALVQYEWLLSHALTVDAAGYDRLIRPLLADLVDWSRANPNAFSSVAARALLEKYRDEAEHTVTANSIESVKHARNLNNALRLPARNLALYKSLPPSAAKRFLERDALGELVREHRYQEARSLIDWDRFIYVDGAGGQTGASAKGKIMARGSPSADKRWSDSRILIAVEILIGVKDVNKAQQLAAHALANSDDKSGLRDQLFIVAQRTAGESAYEFTSWLEAQISDSPSP